MSEKVIIIGAGIAGLSAGVYLQMNGYETEIFEMHHLPGGLCTSWSRKGYLFDGCLHTLSGMNPFYKQYKYWNEIFDTNSLRYYKYDCLAQYEDHEGNKVSLYTDPDKLEKELLSIAPEDKQFISRMTEAIKKLSKYDLTQKKPIELWNPLDYYLSQFRTRPVMKELMQWKNPIQSYIEECKSPLLKKVLDLEFFSHFPAYFFLISIGSMYNGNAVYPIGGSLQIAKLFEKKYLDLGGKIHYNSKVSRINVKDGKAVGITLEKGDVIGNAHAVISAADGHSTIYSMLEGKYVNEQINKIYREHPLWPSNIIVFLGVSCSMENEPAYLDLIIDSPIKIDDETDINRLTITTYNFDDSLSGKGKSIIRVIMPARNDSFWCGLRNTDMEKYKLEKERIASDTIQVLEKRFPDIIGHIEVTDVCTPATFVRYTNNWRGSTEGWEWLPGLIPETMKKQLPGLKNFYMAGQWVEPGGGVSTAHLSGRNIARILCHKDKKKFQTEEAKTWKEK